MKPKSLVWLLAVGLLAGAGAVEFPCDADLEATHCPRPTFVSCLQEQKAQLTASCTAYLDDMKACYEEVKGRCGDRPSFLCLAANAASLSETCLNSAFTDDVRQFLGDWKADAWAVVEDGAADVRSVSPCLNDFDTLHCQYAHPAEALGCIAAEVQRVSDRCRAYVDGYQRCVQDVAAACEGARPRLECLWRHAAKLSPECKASPFYRHVEEGLAKAVERVTGVSIPACAVDIVTLPCKLTDAVSCLLAHRQQLTDSCAAFVTDMEGCYDSVKDLCGNAHCKFSCLVRYRHVLSEQCRRSPFFLSVLDAVGEVRADMMQAVVSALESRQEDIQALPLPCLQDFDVSGCDSREPRGALRCLKAEKRRITTECAAYVDGMEVCARDAPTACRAAASLVDCLWDQQESLSQQCKASAFFEHMTEQAVALQQRISAITVPECVADLVKLDCSPSDFVTCLADNRDKLSSPCAAYVSSVEECYDSVQQKCDGAKCMFMCLVENRAAVSQACRSSAFFQRVAATVQDEALDALQSAADALQAINPCQAELEAAQCDTRDPHAAFNCLRASAVPLADQCRARLEGAGECMAAAKDACRATGDLLGCLWEQRAKLADACGAAAYFAELRRRLAAQLPLKPCAADIAGLDCVSYPVSFPATYQCLRQKASDTCPSCQEVLDGVKTCTSAVQDRCPLDNQFAQCVVAQRAILSPACHASAFFGAIVPSGVQTFGECLRDILSLGCPTNDVVAALECLARSSAKLTPSCGKQFTGVVDCVAAVYELCPQPTVQCLLEHEPELQQKCTASALDRVRDMLTGSQAQQVGEVLQCAHEFSRLGCQAAGSVNAGVSCALDTLRDVPTHCHQFLDGMAGCVAEYRSFCQTPLNQLQWLLEHREEMGPECRQSNFVKTFDVKSPKPLLACTFDLLKLRCFSTDLVTNLRCLSNNQNRLSRSCSAALGGFSECMHSVEEKCAQQGVSVAQLLWIYEHQEEFSAQCQASPFFRVTNRLLDAASSGLASTGLLECSTDLRQNGCLARGPGAASLLGCLHTASANPLRFASEQCRGVLANMYRCEDAMRGVCHPDEGLALCVWDHRASLPADCKDFYDEVQARVTVPMPGTADLPRALQGVATLFSGAEWPCAVDQQLLGCDSAAAVEEQVKCLLGSAKQLSSQCQEWFVGRDQCLADVADVCRLRTDLPAGEALRQQQACLWTKVSHLSPSCVGSLFFRYFLYPQQAGQEGPGDGYKPPATTPGEPDTPGQPVQPGDQGGNPTTPTGPQPLPDDILAFYQADAQTGFVGFADVCQPSAAQWCAAEQPAVNPHCNALRQCLTAHQANLAQPCGMWNAGREVCFADVQRVCGSLNAPFKCMMSNPNSMSTACRGTLFWQSVVAWARTVLHVGLSTTPEDSDTSAADGGSRWLAIVVPTAITVGVLAALGAAYLAYRWVVRRQRAGPESGSAFKPMEDSPGAKTPGLVAKKLSPDLVFHAMDKSPASSAEASSDTSSPEFKVFLGDMTPSHV